ncbi:MFS transporter [Leisingera methylohalidivorans DSM 14336]|uniref:MFS transporter n=1 Tax=Leisingera methylohalidivorans DSM 14336 TaxID=999552 RepID=V9VWM2_9RHOB|nr:MFS transporter [Leisingera methylohalidivorans DSM 14336]
MSPGEGLATLPVSIQLLAGLFTATPMSILMGARGRKAGFLLAALFAVLGGALAAYSLIHGLFALLCFAHALLGAAVVSFGLFRFAAAELVAAPQQAKAISLTLGSGLVAALLAPEVFRLFKDSLAPVPLAGAYLAVSAIALAGMLPIAAAKFAPPQPKAGKDKSRGQTAALWNRPRLLWAILCGVGSFAGMMLLMTPTPLAMVGCGFSDVQAADVIRWHVVAMFAPSFFTGSLITRFGANAIVATGAVLLALSGLTALAGIELVHFYVSLVLLGLGWNFGFVGATTLLNSELMDSEKSLFQGINDTGIALGAAIASFSSGLMIASVGWAMIAAALLGFAAVVAFSSFKQRQAVSNTSSLVQY